MSESFSFPPPKVADGDTVGGIPTLLTFNIPDGATGDYDLVPDHKIEVLDVLVHKRSAGAGSNANTVQVKNVASVISDAISINVNQDVVARAAKITAANSVIDPAAGGKLRVSTVKIGGDAACFVVVTAIRR